MPQFREENKYIDLHLNVFLQKAQAHDLDILYAPAERLKKDFECHM
ncbi:MAG: hypothetical protein ACJ06V_06490 [Verrucomicrobiota bacterium]